MWYIVELVFFAAVDGRSFCWRYRLLLWTCSVCLLNWKLTISCCFLPLAFWNRRIGFVITIRTQTWVEIIIQFGHSMFLLFNPVLLCDNPPFFFLSHWLDLACSLHSHFCILQRNCLLESVDIRPTQHPPLLSPCPKPYYPSLYHSYTSNHRRISCILFIATPITRPISNTSIPNHPHFITQTLLPYPCYHTPVTHTHIVPVTCFYPYCFIPYDPILFIPASSLPHHCYCLPFLSSPLSPIIPTSIIPTPTQQHLYHLHPKSATPISSPPTPVTRISPPDPAPCPPPSCSSSAVISSRGNRLGVQSIAGDKKLRFPNLWLGVVRVTDPAGGKKKKRRRRKHRSSIIVGN